MQEFIPKDDIASEAFGPSNCVLGLDTPSTTSFFVPNAIFVGVVVPSPKRPFVVVLLYSEEVFSVFLVLSLVKPYVNNFVHGPKAPYATIVIGP